MRLKKHFDLQSMCLNVIIGHIDFYVNNSHLPKKAMAFFHRKYSDAIYKSLKDRNIFCEKYMMWLMTPYWKNITFSESLLSDSKSILKKFKLNGEFITSLDFNCCTIRPELLKAVIFCVPYITHLSLRGIEFPSHILACFGKVCPSLVALDLMYCHSVDDDAIIGLCHGQDDTDSFRLTHLDITSTGVESLGIDTILVKLKHLKVLRHHGLASIFVRIHNDHERLPRFAYNLREFLDIFTDCDLELGTILEEWSLYCPYIERAEIHDIEDSDFEHLSKFKHLKELKISFFKNKPPVRRFDRFIVTSGENLTKLYLSDIKIDIVTLVSYCKNLEYVYFRDVYFTPVEKQALKSNSSLKHLKTLVFAHAVFSDPDIFQGFQLLVSLSNLEKLSVRYCLYISEKVTDVILGSSSQLELLDFSFTDIKIDLLLPFFDCPKLSKLHIDACTHVPLRDFRVSRFTKTCEFGNTLSWHVDFYSNRDIAGVPIFGRSFY